MRSHAQVRCPRVQPGPNPFSTLQRLNVISSFALSVVMALAAVVALTGLWHPSVQGSVKVNDLQVYVAGAG